MSELIANTDLTLGHDVSSATLVVTNPPDTKVKANGSNVYKGSLTVAVSNAVQGSCGSASASVTILSTTAKTNLSSQGVMREKDDGTATANGTLLVTPFTPCSFPITVDIRVAGQTKVKSE